jgi:hypothetical protein
MRFAVAALSLSPKVLCAGAYIELPDDVARGIETDGLENQGWDVARDMALQWLRVCAAARRPEVPGGQRRPHGTRLDPVARVDPVAREGVVLGPRQPLDHDSPWHAATGRMTDA